MALVILTGDAHTHTRNTQRCITCKIMRNVVTATASSNARSCLLVTSPGSTISPHNIDCCSSCDLGLIGGAHALSNGVRGPSAAKSLVRDDTIRPRSRLWSSCLWAVASVIARKVYRWEALRKPLHSSHRFPFPSTWDRIEGILPNAGCRLGMGVSDCSDHGERQILDGCSGGHR